jgi:hypothetical protein
VGVLFTNNASTTLSAAISSTSATSISVASSSTFPAPGAGEYFYATIDDGTNNEIVKVTAVSGTTWTVVRASDNTTARTFSSGDTVQLRAAAALLTDIQQNIAAKSANQTVYNATTASSATSYDVGTNPQNENNAMVFLDGVMQHHDTFSFSGSTLTFDAAPSNGLKLEVIIDNLINLQSSNLTVDTFTATNGQTAFTLSDTPAAEDNLIVFIEGVFQNQDSYSISNNVLTMSAGVTTGRKVVVYVINPVNIGTPSDGTVTSAKLSGNITMPGTLTVGSNDVAFDSPTFVVDNANSRVGLGTASPSVPVDIVGDVKMSSTLDLTSHLDMPDNAKIKLGTGDDLEIYHDGSHNYIDAVTGDQDIIFKGTDSSSDITALTLDMSEAGKATFNSGVVTGGPLTLGDYIEKTSGNLTIDVAGDIILDADGEDIILKDGGTEWGLLSADSTDFTIMSRADDRDLIFKGKDGGSTITALTLDMSDAGTAIFNNQVGIGATPATAAGISKYLYVEGGDPGIVLKDSTANDVAEIYNAGGKFIIYGGSGGTNADVAAFDLPNKRLGIGTISPSYTLDVNTSGSASAFRVSNSTNGQDLNCTISNSGTTAGDDSLFDITTQNGAGDPKVRFTIAGYENYEIGIDNTDGDKFKISQGSALGTTDRITVSGANVGIGTSSPVEPLHVVDSASSGVTPRAGTIAFFEDDAAARITLGSANDNDCVIHFADADDNDVGGITYSHGGDRMEFKVNASERARITSGGNFLVGRGDTTVNSSNFGICLFADGRPKFSKDVTGGSHVMNVYGNAGEFRVYGDGDVQNTNNSYGQISDVSLKENIVDATDKLNEINQIRVRNFNFIGDDLKQIGVIAQELETIFPSLVTIDEEEDVKTVKYSVFVPILIKALQEADDKIDALEARITALES